MITAPAEPMAIPNEIAAAELLIKEARRKARRRRLITAASLIVIAVAALSIKVALSPKSPVPQSTSDVQPAGIAMCTNSSLRISAQNGDGLHHGVEFLHFKNVSGTACTLTGYPVVRAILDSAKGPSRLDGMYAPAPANSSKRALDVQYSWAGGIDSGDVPLKGFAAPTIVLIAHGGVATSTLNWTDGPNGKGTCPAFTNIDIDLGGRSVTRIVRPYEPLCYQFAVTPIVKGSTGSMFVKADYSKKANDLAYAREDSSSLRASAVTLYRELQRPSKFTFNEEMQTAESLEDASQSLIEGTPWPQLNSSMAAVGQDSERLGNSAYQHFVQSAHRSNVRKQCLKLLANVKSLNNLLRELT
jgi:Protein of unknown function (DUF4232)